jgi:hypothetical protein
VVLITLWSYRYQSIGCLLPWEDDFPSLTRALSESKAANKRRKRLNRKHSQDPTLV